MTDIFIHIPKTAGTTLATTLRWVYGPWTCYRHNPERPNRIEEFMTRRQEVAPNARCVMGHVQYGVHRHLTMDGRYFTLLRHPIRRFISRYYFLRMGYPNATWPTNLKEFCQSDHSWSRPNDLVRFVSGKDPTRYPQASLETAKDHLHNEFAAFGLTERFDASLLLFRRRLHWSRPPFYVSSLQNSDRPTLDELPPDMVEVVREHHQLDLALYQWAKRSFRETLEEEFDNVSGELRSFRRKNRRVQRVAPLLLSLYRTGRSLLRRLT